MLKTMRSLSLTGEFSTPSERMSVASITESSTPLTTQQAGGTSGASSGAPGPTPELAEMSSVPSTERVREPQQLVETNQPPQTTQSSLAIGPAQPIQPSQEAEPTQASAVPEEAAESTQAAEPTQGAVPKQATTQAREGTSQAPEEPTPPGQTAPAAENTANAAETIQAVEPTQATTDVASGSTVRPKVVTFAQPKTATIEITPPIQPSRIYTPQTTGSSTTETAKTSDQTPEASEENASAGSTHNVTSTQASILPAHPSTILPSDISAQQTAESAPGTETASESTQQMLKPSAEPSQNPDAPAPITPPQQWTAQSTGSTEHDSNTAAAPTTTSGPTITSNKEVPAQDTASESASTEKPTDTDRFIMTTRTEHPDSSTTEPSGRTTVSNVEFAQQGSAAAFVVPNQGIWEEYNTVKAAAAAARAAQSPPPVTLDATDSIPTSTKEPGTDADSGGMPRSMPLDQYGAFKASIAEGAEQEASQTSTVPGSGASPDTNTAASLNMSRSDQQVGQTSTGTAGEIIPETKQESSTAPPVTDFSSFLASTQDSQKSASKESASKESASKEAASKESASQESISKEPASKESVSNELVSNESVSKESVSTKTVSKESASDESAMEESASRATDAAATEGWIGATESIPAATSVDQSSIASTPMTISATKGPLDGVSGNPPEAQSTENPNSDAPVKAGMSTPTSSQDTEPPTASVKTSVDNMSGTATVMGLDTGSANATQEQVIDTPNTASLVTSLSSEPPTTTALSSSKITSSTEPLPAGPSTDETSKEHTDNAPAAKDVAINLTAEEPIAPAVPTLDISKVMMSGYCCQQCAAEGK